MVAGGNNGLEGDKPIEVVVVSGPSLTRALLATFGVYLDGDPDSYLQREVGSGGQESSGGAGKVDITQQKA